MGDVPPHPPRPRPLGQKADERDVHLLAARERPGERPDLGREKRVAAGEGIAEEPDRTGRRRRRAHRGEKRDPRAPRHPREERRNADDCRHGEKCGLCPRGESCQKARHHGMARSQSAAGACGKVDRAEQRRGAGEIAGRKGAGLPDEGRRSQHCGCRQKARRRVASRQSHDASGGHRRQSEPDEPREDDEPVVVKWQCEPRREQLGIQRQIRHELRHDLGEAAMLDPRSDGHRVVAEVVDEITRAGRERAHDRKRREGDHRPGGNARRDGARRFQHDEIRKPAAVPRPESDRCGDPADCQSHGQRTQMPGESRAKHGKHRADREQRAQPHREVEAPSGDGGRPAPCQPEHAQIPDDEQGRFHPSGNQNPARRFTRWYSRGCRGR